MRLTAGTAIKHSILMMGYFNIWLFPEPAIFSLCFMIHFALILLLQAHGICCITNTRHEFLKPFKGLLNIPMRCSKNQTWFRGRAADDFTFAPSTAWNKRSTDDFESTLLASSSTLFFYSFVFESSCFIIFGASLVFLRLLHHRF